MDPSPFSFGLSLGLFSLRYVRNQRYLLQREELQGILDRVGPEGGSVNSADGRAVARRDAVAQK